MPPGHIPEMIALIQRLIERGHAYVSGGSVYFDVEPDPVVVVVVAGCAVVASVVPPGRTSEDEASDPGLAGLFDEAAIATPPAVACTATNAHSPASSARTKLRQTATPPARTIETRRASAIRLFPRFIACPRRPSAGADRSPAHRTSLVVRLHDSLPKLRGGQSPNRGNRPVPAYSMRPFPNATRTADGRSRTPSFV